MSLSEVDITVVPVENHIGSTEKGSTEQRESVLVGTQHTNTRVKLHNKVGIVDIDDLAGNGEVEGSALAEINAVNRILSTD